MEKLKKLIGIKYNYNGKNIIITEIKKVSDNIIVKTDGLTYNLYQEEVDTFIENLKDPKKEYVSTIKNDATSLENDATSFDLKTTLIDTINKVKNDISYVKQANCICNITSQMINIRKLELMELKK